MKFLHPSKTTFTTSLSKNEVLDFVRQQQPDKLRELFTIKEDMDSSKDGAFTLHKNIRLIITTGHNPKVRGRILSEYPTTIEIKVRSHYFILLFLLIFPVVFTYASIFSEQMNINGVTREPELHERILFGLAGILIPFLCYFLGVIIPFKQAKAWIVGKIRLAEMAGAA